MVYNFPTIKSYYSINYDHNQFKTTTVTTKPTTALTALKELNRIGNYSKIKEQEMVLIKQVAHEIHARCFSTHLLIRVCQKIYLILAKWLPFSSTLSRIDNIHHAIQQLSVKPPLISLSSESPESLEPFLKTLPMELNVHVIDSFEELDVKSFSSLLQVNRAARQIALSHPKFRAYKKTQKLYRELNELYLHYKKWGKDTYIVNNINIFITKGRLFNQKLDPAATLLNLKTMPSYLITHYINFAIEKAHAYDFSISIVSLLNFLCEHRPKNSSYAFSKNQLEIIKDSNSSSFMPTSLKQKIALQKFLLYFDSSNSDFSFNFIHSRSTAKYSVFAKPDQIARQQKETLHNYALAEVYVELGYHCTNWEFRQLLLSDPLPIKLIQKILKQKHDRLMPGNHELAAYCFHAINLCSRDSYSQALDSSKIPVSYSSYWSSLLADELKDKPVLKSLIAKYQANKLNAALCVAVSHDDINLVRSLIDQGADASLLYRDRELLHYLNHNRHKPLIAFMIDQYKEAILPFMSYLFEEKLFTILHTILVKQLSSSQLIHSVMDVMDRSRKTALDNNQQKALERVQHFSSEDQHLLLLALITHLPFSPLIEEDQAKKPTGHVNIITALNNRRRLEILECYNYYFALIQQLIDGRKIDINKTNAQGFSALTLALFKKNPDTKLLELLLNAGADPLTGPTSFRPIDLIAHLSEEMKDRIKKSRSDTNL